MIINKTSEQYFEDFFDRWCMENDIAHMKVTRISRPIGYNCASSYDDWKTSNREDCIKTKEYKVFVDTNVLYDLAQKAWKDEIDENVCQEYEKDGEEYFYMDIRYIFNSVLKDYKNNIYEEYENEFEL